MGNYQNVAMQHLTPITSFRLNELGRSIGSGDLYPFVLSEKVIAKMRFISQEIEAYKAGR